MTQKRSKKNSLTPSRVVDEVCRELKISEAALKSRVRTPEVVSARRAIATILREEFFLTWDKVAEMIGQSGHSGAAHLVRTLESDSTAIDLVEKLTG